MFRSVYQGGDCVEVLTVKGKDGTKYWKLSDKVVREYDPHVKSYVLSCLSSTSPQLEAPPTSRQSLVDCLDERPDRAAIPRSVEFPAGTASSTVLYFPSEDAVDARSSGVSRVHATPRRSTGPKSAGTKHSPTVRPPHGIEGTPQRSKQSSGVGGLSPRREVGAKLRETRVPVDTEANATVIRSPPRAVDRGVGSSPILRRDTRRLQADVDSGLDEWEHPERGTMVSSKSSSDDEPPLDDLVDALNQSASEDVLRHSHLSRWEREVFVQSSTLTDSLGSNSFAEGDSVLHGGRARDNIEPSVPAFHPADDDVWPDPHGSAYFPEEQRSEGSARSVRDFDDLRASGAGSDHSFDVQSQHDDVNSVEQMLDDLEEFARMEVLRDEERSPGAALRRTVATEVVSPKIEDDADDSDDKELLHDVFFTRTVDCQTLDATGITSSEMKQSNSSSVHEIHEDLLSPDRFGEELTHESEPVPLTDVREENDGAMDDTAQSGTLRTTFQPQLENSVLPPNLFRKPEHERGGEQPKAPSILTESLPTSAVEATLLKVTQWLSTSGVDSPPLATQSLPDDLKALLQKQKELEDRLARLDAMDDFPSADVDEEGLDFGDSLSDAFSTFSRTQRPQTVDSLGMTAFQATDHLCEESGVLFESLAPGIRQSNLALQQHLGLTSPCSVEEAASPQSSDSRLKLIFDPVLKCYFDPVANKYYELCETSK